MKSANTSLHICLANNLFVRTDAKKDAKKSPYFAYLVPLSIPRGTRLQGTSLHDITPLGFCDFLHPRSSSALPHRRCFIPPHCALSMFPPIPFVAVDPSDEFEREILREFDFMDFDFAR